MGYYIGKSITTASFDEVIERTTAALKTEGFGILNTIDMKATLKTKVDADIQKYMILGACNPGFAHKALLAEDRIGVLLPCSVVVKEGVDGAIDVAIVNPDMFGEAINNNQLDDLMTQLKAKLDNVLERI